MPDKHRKRLVFCFDGTWNRLLTSCPTNVVKLAQMVAADSGRRDTTDRLVTDRGWTGQNNLADRPAALRPWTLRRSCVRSHRFPI